MKYAFWSIVLFFCSKCMERSQLNTKSIIPLSKITLAMACDAGRHAAEQAKNRQTVAPHSIQCHRSEIVELMALHFNQ